MIGLEVKWFVLVFQGKWVLPALKQLLQIAKNIAKNSFNKAEKVCVCSMYLTLTNSHATQCRVLIFFLVGWGREGGGWLLSFVFETFSCVAQ